MIINNDKILYTNTFNRKKVYSANRAYWYKIIKKYTKEGCQNDWYKYFPRFSSNHADSDYPICVFYNQQLNKCVRIIQYAPNDFDEKHQYKQYLTAWVSTIEINNEDVKELVICLLLTHNNSYKAEELIKHWINSDDKKLRENIKSIYYGQGNAN